MEIETRKSSRRFFLSAAILILALSAGLHVNSHSTEAKGKSASPTSSAPVKTYGAKNAPITIEVFSDYQCPTCGRLYEETLRPLIQDYVATGKVYLIHRDFPLPPPLHLYSGQAARWANAAAQIGQFERVESALYDNQASWAVDGNIEKFISENLPSSDFKRVQEIMKGCKAPGPTAGNPSPYPCSVDTYIEQDIELGKRVPVQGTPTYIITAKGQALPSGQNFVSWPILKQLLDQLLSQ